MKVQVGFIAWATIALAVAAWPMSSASVLPQCADLRDNDGDGGTSFPQDPECVSPLGRSESGAIEQDSGGLCGHASPHSHTFGTSGGVAARSDTVTGGDEVGSSMITVQETNVVDCNGDGLPWDYDGDFETGIGGGFFGYGPWRDEPTCNYGLKNHGSFVVVADAVFGGNIAFVIGADDTSGPVVEVDPVDGSTSCSADGSITPGDPMTDPTADPDDCLTETYIGSGTNTCGYGGDGGYWVFLTGVFVDESGGNPTVSSFPTVGTITA